MSIIEQLEVTRKAAHLTQAELAGRSGMNRMTVGRMEAGMDPRLSTVEELARAMGMDIILVPRALRSEVENFVQAGGKLIAQPPGVGAPKSIIDLLPVDAARQ